MSNYWSRARYDLARERTRQMNEDPTKPKYSAGGENKGYWSWFAKNRGNYSASNVSNRYVAKQLAKPEDINYGQSSINDAPTSTDFLGGFTPKSKNYFGFGQTEIKRDIPLASTLSPSTRKNYLQNVATSKVISNLVTEQSGKYSQGVSSYDQSISEVQSAPADAQFTYGADDPTLYSKSDILAMLQTDKSNYEKNYQTFQGSVTTAQQTLAKEHKRYEIESQMTKNRNKDISIIEKGINVGREVYNKVPAFISPVIAPSQRIMEAGGIIETTGNVGLGLAYLGSPLMQKENPYGAVSLIEESFGSDRAKTQAGYFVDTRQEVKYITDTYGTGSNEFANMIRDTPAGNLALTAPMLYAGGGVVGSGINALVSYSAGAGYRASYVLPNVLKVGGAVVGAKYLTDKSIQVAEQGWKPALASFVGYEAPQMLVVGAGMKAGMLDTRITSKYSKLGTVERMRTMDAKVVKKTNWLQLEKDGEVLGSGSYDISLKSEGSNSAFRRSYTMDIKANPKMDTWNVPEGQIYYEGTIIEGSGSRLLSPLEYYNPSGLKTFGLNSGGKSSFVSGVVPSQTIKLRGRGLYTDESFLFDGKGLGISTKYTPTAYSVTDSKFFMGAGDMSLKVSEIQVINQLQGKSVMTKYVTPKSNVWKPDDVITTVSDDLSNVVFKLQPDSKSITITPSQNYIDYFKSAGQNMPKITKGSLTSSYKTDAQLIDSLRVYAKGYTPTKTISTTKTITIPTTSALDSKVLSHAISEQTSILTSQTGQTSGLSLSALSTKLSTKTATDTKTTTSSSTKIGTFTGIVTSPSLVTRTSSLTIPDTRVSTFTTTTPKIDTKIATSTKIAVLEKPALALKITQAYTPTTLTPPPAPVVPTIPIINFDFTSKKGKPKSKTSLSLFSKKNKKRGDVMPKADWGSVSRVHASGYTALHPSKSISKSWGKMVKEKGFGWTFPAIKGRRLF